MTSHPLYVWHHTWHMYDIICTRHDITSTLYDIKLQYSWHHTHCVYDITPTIYDITPIVYDITTTIHVT